MAKSIRQVKSKKKIRESLTNKLRSYRGTTPVNEQELLENFINLDPIFAGREDKFDFNGTREQWIKFHAELDFENKSGHWMEFGVREGTTIEQFLRYRPEAHIHGFDSWEGLPEAWDVGNKVYQPGDMAVPMPKFDSRVELHKGWFNDTIDPWKAKHEGPIQLLHVDGDLYSSANTVLTKLNDRIVRDTVIIFDEIANWRLAGKMSEWCNGEWLALVEWIEKFDRKVEPLARSCLNQASVTVIK